MRALAGLSKIFRSVLNLCYPPHCAGCGADTAPGCHVCETCVETMERIEPPFCDRCSEPYPGAMTDVFICPNCSDRTIHFENAVAPYLSRGIVRDCIHSFKYSGARYLRATLAGWLAEALDDARIAAREFDAFVPVPLHPVRQREREYNQAEELCRELAKRTGVPMWRALRRIRYTTTQTRLDREERMENLRGAFQVSDNALVKDRDLILVDDVFTTGSTVEECSRVLVRAGARAVRVLCVARG